MKRICIGLLFIHFFIKPCIAQIEAINNTYITNLSQIVSQLNAIQGLISNTNASVLTTGTIRNTLLDRSSVTLMGNATDFRVILYELQLATTSLSNSFILGFDVVRSSHILDGAIIGNDLAAAIIQATHTSAGVFLLNGLDVVRSSHILDNSLGGIDIAVGTIGSTHTLLGVSSITVAGFTVGGGSFTYRGSSVTIVTSTLTIGGVTRALPIINCGSGQVLKDNGSGIFYCANDNDSGAFTLGFETVRSSNILGGVSRSARIVVGTAALQNVDIITTSDVGLSMAITSVTADRSGGTIIIREGDYTLQNTWVIPSSVTVFIDNGAVIRRGTGCQHCVKINGGRLTGGIFEADSLTLTGTSFITLNGNESTIDNFKFRDSDGNSNTEHFFIDVKGNNSKVLYGIFTNNTIIGSQAGLIHLSTESIGTMVIGNQIFENNTTAAGDGGVFYYIDSTGTYLFKDNISVNNSQNDGNSNTFDFFIRASSGGSIVGNTFNRSRATGSNCMLIQPNADGGGGRPVIAYLDISNNTFISGTDVINVNVSNSTEVVRNLIIKENKFIRHITSAINIKRGTSGSAVNTFIHGNVAVTTGTFISENAGSVNTRKRDNMIEKSLQGDSDSD